MSKNALSSGQLNETLAAEPVTKVLTDQDDYYNGFYVSEVVYALGGNDIVRMWGQGDHQIHLGDGDDVVYTQAGDDTLDGGAGDDFMNGGAGTDTAIYAGAPSDYFITVVETNASVVGVNPDVEDYGGIDSIRSIEFLSFSKTGEVLSLAEAETFLLENDAVAYDMRAPTHFEVDNFLNNDRYTSYETLSVDGTSEFGADIRFDGAKVIYDPDDTWDYLREGESRIDSFTYSIADSVGNSKSATVTVTVTGKDDPLEARDDYLSSVTTQSDEYTEIKRFTISERPTDDSSHFPQSVLLPDGSFATVWVDDYDSLIKTEALALTITSPDGVVQTRAIHLTEQGTSYKPLDIAVAEDGNILVTWVYQDWAQDITKHQYQFFDSTGTALGEPKEFSEGFSGDKIVTLQNGNFAVIDSVNEDINGLILDPTGQEAGPKFSIPFDPFQYEKSANVTAMPNGGFVVVFHERDSESGAQAVMMRRFDNHGEGIGVEEQLFVLERGDIPYRSNSLYQPQVFADDDGNLGLLWPITKPIPDASTSDRTIELFYQFMDANGALVGEPVLLTEDFQFSGPTNPAWLPDGRFVVSWQTPPGPELGFDVKAQVFERDGSPVSESFYVDNGENTSEKASNVVVLENGNFAITWWDNGMIRSSIYGPDGGYTDRPFADGSSVVEISAARLLSNDVDLDGDALTIVSTSATSALGAIVTFDAETGNVRYDPTASTAFRGIPANGAVEDVFLYTVTNGEGDTQTAEVTILIGNGTEIITPAPSGGVTLSGAGRDADLTGGMGDDMLSGFAGDDSLRGLEGQDVLRGGKGDDWLSGGEGVDRLFGGDGQDIAEGGAGDDFIEGGAGGDDLSGDAGNDQLFGNVGNDLLSGGAGDDALGGGAGQDHLDGGTGNDALYGGAQSDLLHGNAGDDFLSGDADNDTLRGGSGEDALLGGAGDDTLSGETHNDLLFGGDGDDRLYGGAGADQLDGGTGDDQLAGDSGADVLRGKDGSDELRGGTGNDKLFGGSGNDRLEGGAGQDFLSGGTGDDSFVFLDATASRINSSDVINGFEGVGVAGGDVIDLSAIDADLSKLGDQRFTFLGETTTFDALNVGAGSLWVVEFGGQTSLYGNLDGDQTIDFAVRINDGATISAADYLESDLIL